MVRRVLAVGCILAGLSPACGASVPVTTGPTASPPSSTTTAREVRPTRYEVDATVLATASAPPELCAGGVLDSLPPQCGGPPVIGWDWDAVSAEQTAGGVTWGEFHLVGTYDGTSFTLTEPASAPRPPAGSGPGFSADYATPCPAPPGGWGIVDGSKVALEDYQTFSTVARDAPDFAGIWVDGSTNPDGIEGVPTEQVMNVAYTGDLERHRAELAAVWGGPICVLHHDRTIAELGAISNDLTGEGGRALGLQVLSGGVDDVANVVRLDLIVADAGIQQRIDDRWGPGLVVATGALRPLPDG